MSQPNWGQFRLSPNFRPRISLQSKTPQSRVKRRWGQGKETVSVTLPIVAGSFNWIRRGWYETPSSNPDVRKDLVCSGTGCAFSFLRHQGTFCCRFDDV